MNLCGAVLHHADQRRAILPAHPESRQTAGVCGMMLLMPAEQPIATVEVVSELTDEVAEAARALLPQLSSSASYSRELLETMVGSDSAALFVARVDGTIVGMASLIHYAIPTGVRAHIDDVVVDSAERGHGVGRLLLRALLDEANRLGARTVDLTSRPSREAAIRLYESVGFVRRESLLFRFQG
jgi:ribosomal protein S18 acetylase RimI-like enzyme